MTLLHEKSKDSAIAGHGRVGRLILHITYHEHMRVCDNIRILRQGYFSVMCHSRSSNVRKIPDLEAHALSSEASSAGRGGHLRHKLEKLIDTAAIHCEPCMLATLTLGDMHSSQKYMILRAKQFFENLTARKAR